MRAIVGRSEMWKVKGRLSKPEARQSGPGRAGPGVVAGRQAGRPAGRPETNTPASLQPRPNSGRPTRTTPSPRPARARRSGLVRTLMPVPLRPRGWRRTKARRSARRLPAVPRPQSPLLGVASGARRACGRGRPPGIAAVRWDIRRDVKRGRSSPPAGAPTSSIVPSPARQDRGRRRAGLGACVKRFPGACARCAFSRLPCCRSRFRTPRHGLFGRAGSAGGSSPLATSSRLRRSSESVAPAFGRGVASPRPLRGAASFAPSDSATTALAPLGAGLLPPSATDSSPGPTDAPVRSSLRSASHAERPQPTSAGSSAAIPRDRRPSALVSPSGLPLPRRPPVIKESPKGETHRACRTRLGGTR